MRRKPLLLCETLLIFLLCASYVHSVISAGSAYVYVHQPESPYHWKGKWFSGYYAGASYVDVRSSSYGNQPGGETTRAYCINYGAPIYVGREYYGTLTPATDTEKWREIAYILTWYDGGDPVPAGGPSSDTMGVSVQGALWKILDGIIPSWIPTQYRTGINDLFNEATDPPKDVIRVDDRFEWIYPEVGNNINLIADPGETVTLKAKVTHLVNGNWLPRSGVKIEFSASAGSLDKTIAWTDSDGVVEVVVTIPADAVELEIEVRAGTKGLWPQKFLDLGGDKQDLIGIDTTYQLTVTTNVWILANIRVVPEVPLGTLAALVACLSAYLVMAKKGVRIN